VPFDQRLPYDCRASTAGGVFLLRFSPPLFFADCLLLELPSVEAQVRSASLTRRGGAARARRGTVVRRRRVFRPQYLANVFQPSSTDSVAFHQIGAVMSCSRTEHDSRAGEAPIAAAMFRQSINPSLRLSAVGPQSVSAAVADHVGSMPATMVGSAAAAM